MAQKTFLVVGGAGYIGSHMVKMLLQNRHHVVTLDNLSTGYRDAISGGDFVLFVLADLSDKTALNSLFESYAFDGVMHFASFIQVGESVPVVNAPRRTGDPARLVADAARATRELNWRPQYADLETLIKHAWSWEQKLAAQSSALSAP